LWFKNRDGVARLGNGRVRQWAVEQAQVERARTNGVAEQVGQVEVVLAAALAVAVSGETADAKVAAVDPVASVVSAMTVASVSA
jgi:hypothetical protein